MPQSRPHGSLKTTMTAQAAIATATPSQAGVSSARSDGSRPAAARRSGVEHAIAGAIEGEKGARHPRIIRVVTRRSLPWAPPDDGHRGDPDERGREREQDESLAPFDVVVSRTRDVDRHGLDPGVLGPAELVVLGMDGDQLLVGHDPAVGQLELAVQVQVVVAVRELAADLGFAEEDLLLDVVDGRDTTRRPASA